MAELTAIVLSLKCVHKLGSHLNYNISIISDSRAAIQNICKPFFKRNTTPIIIFIRNLLQYLMDFQNCKNNFIWVSGHAGIPRDKTLLPTQLPHPHNTGTHIPTVISYHTSRLNTLESGLTTSIATSALFWLLSHTTHSP